MLYCFEVFKINVVFKNLKNYKVKSILGPTFKLFEAILELLVPLVVADIIDNGIKSGDVMYVVYRSLLLILMGAVGLAFSVTAQYFSAKAAVGCATSIRHNLFQKLQSLSFTQIDKVGTSTMITRMTSDVNQVQTGINLVLRLLLRSPFVVFGAMIMAFTVNAKAAIIFVIVIPILMVVVMALMLITIPLYKKVQNMVDALVRVSRENLSGIRVIRAFCREDAEKEDFDNKNQALDKFQNLVGMVSALMNPLTFVIINIGIICLIKSGAVMIENNQLLSGELVALYNYMSQILVELIKFASLIITVTKSIASANRISEVMDIKTDEESNDGITSESYKVSFNNVSFRYDGASEDSLCNISFDANQGEKIGIIGGTGSGKSTLANLIPAFYLATEGNIEIGGVDVKLWNKTALNRIVGVVPQKATLFKGTIRENLLWGNENADDETLQIAIDMAQATDVVKSKKLGLDELVEQGGTNFSGGQRQRLTIARAIVKQPKILILDDSSSALDYATDAALREAISSLNDTTVFMISQRASSLLNCDRIVVLDDGVQVGYGNHNELLQNCDVYKEIYYSQFESEGEVQ